MSGTDGEARAALAREFEAHRGRLFGIAYRLLGEVGRAQDMVQDAWMRLQRAEVTPENLGAWLATTVSRLCLDELRSARSRREAYVGTWLPEPLLHLQPGEDPMAEVERSEDLSMAMLVVLESLTPLERVVFVLREVFGYSYPELAGMLGRSEVAVRQLAHRAREHVQARRPRFEPDAELRRQAVDRFMRAAATGDVQALAETLAEEVVLLSDGGGRVPAARRPLVGRDRVARFVAALVARYSPLGYRWSRGLVNAEEGLLLWRGDALDTVATLQVTEGVVSRIHVQRNPDKLAPASGDSAGAHPAHGSAGATPGQ